MQYNHYDKKIDYISLTSIFVRLKSPTQKGKIRVESGRIRLRNHRIPPLSISGHKAFSDKQKYSCFELKNGTLLL